MNRFKSIVVAAIVVAVATAFSIPAPDTSAQSSASLSIVPKKNYTVEAGKSIKDTLVIRNLDEEKTLDLRLRVVDFTFRDDTGTPKLMLEENAPQTTWSLKPFITLPETVSIAPKASKTLDMSVAIPASQGAGSYYSAILYSSGAPDGGNVGLSASGVTLAFVSVPGDVNEELKLENFGAYNIAEAGKPAGYTFFTADKPKTMAYTLKNGGNVTEAPVGSITLRHMFGAETVIDDVNPNKSLALVGQSRTFTACIKLQEQKVDFNGSKSESKTCAEPDLWPGIYTASLNVYYGQNGNNTNELVGSAAFVYLPWWFVILFLIVAAFAAFGIWRLVRKIKGGRKSGNLKRSLRRRR